MGQGRLKLYLCRFELGNLKGGNGPKSFNKLAIVGAWGLKGLGILGIGLGNLVLERGL